MNFHFGLFVWSLILKVWSWENVKNSSEDFGQPDVSNPCTPGVRAGQNNGRGSGNAFA